jgi:hypothetical protein
MVVLGGQTHPQLLGVSPFGAANAFFDDTVLQEVRLVVNSRDWQTLKDRWLENTYYPADLQWRDVTVRNVGIRQRGTGSRSPIKPGLGVSFDKYVTGQTFLGLESVVLRNNTQDPSNMHERLSMLLFRRMGLPASREAHMKLFVNNEYVGLYTIVESLDEPFLKRTFGEDTGYLFSYDYPVDAQPYLFEYRGPDPRLYVPLPFKPETHSSNPRPEFIEQLVWTINETNNSIFRDAIAGYLDIAKFIRHVAIETFLTDNDGVLGDWGMNNFYMYRFDGQNLFTLLPWDKSEAFKNGVTYSIFHNIDVPSFRRNRLMDRVLSYPDLVNLYLDTLLECVQSAGEPAPGSPNGPGWLERELQSEYAQIREAALADPVKPFTNAEFERDVSDMVTFARNRGAAVAAEVESTRSAQPGSAYPRRLSQQPPPGQRPSAGTNRRVRE